MSKDEILRGIYAAKSVMMYNNIDNDPLNLKQKQNRQTKRGENPCIFRQDSNMCTLNGFIHPYIALNLFMILSSVEHQSYN